MSELHQFGRSWAISEIAFNEFQYVRRFQPDGSVTNAAVSAQFVLAQYPLSVHQLDHQETQTFVSLAVRIDDGEAASLAVAKHRGLTFVSEDRLAVVMAQSIAVPTISSLDLLQAWGGTNQVRVSQFPNMLHRIATLASWVPPKSSPHRGWWDRLLTPS